ncbi:hypothetical protein ACHHYP_05539 [Achlya hypogyna]|uniref:Uncharacterized protein n=1 Tax=Achlya hypogyna TaxID=1202772 RepID=A0A1V9ZNN2_ACHHY|nr:hypothetical protein ACHHYP_05539 [Achlya hypogyna]
METVDALDAKRWELLALLEEERFSKGVYELPVAPTIFDVASDIVDAMDRGAWKNPHYVLFVKSFLRRAALLDFVRMDSACHDSVVPVCRGVTRDALSPIDLVRQSTRLLLRIGHRSARYAIRVVGTDLFLKIDNACPRYGAESSASPALRLLTHEICSELCGSQTLHAVPFLPVSILLTFASSKLMYELLGSQDDPIQIAQVLNQALVTKTPIAHFGAAKILSIIILDTPFERAQPLVHVLVDALGDEHSTEVQAGIAAVLWDVLYLRMDLFTQGLWAELAPSVLAHDSFVRVSIHAMMRALLSPRAASTLHPWLAAQLLERLTVFYTEEASRLREADVAMLFQFFSEEYGHTEAQQAVVVHTILTLPTRTAKPQLRGALLIDGTAEAYLGGLELPSIREAPLATRAEASLRRANQLLQAMLPPPRKADAVRDFQASAMRHDYPVVIAAMMYEAFYSSYPPARVRWLLACD